MRSGYKLGPSLAPENVWCWPYQPLGLASVRVQTSPAGMERDGEGERRRPGMTHGSMQWVPSWSWGNPWCVFTLYVNANLKHIHMLLHRHTPTHADTHTPQTNAFQHKQMGVMEHTHTHTHTALDGLGSGLPQRNRSRTRPYTHT